MRLWSLLDPLLVTAPCSGPHILNSSQRTVTTRADCSYFGPQWFGKVVQFKVDNATVVQVIEATYSQNAHLMHLEVNPLPATENILCYYVTWLG